MSGDAPHRRGLCRLQLQEDRDGRQGGTCSTRTAPWSAGIRKVAAEREARLDAERLREQLATAPIMGEVDEVTG
jgi:hypothetical protein